jgi:hypothetical protein
LSGNHEPGLETVPLPRRLRHNRVMCHRSPSPFERRLMLAISGRVFRSGNGGGDGGGDGGLCIQDTGAWGRRDSNPLCAARLVEGLHHVKTFKKGLTALPPDQGKAPGILAS